MKKFYLKDLMNYVSCHYDLDFSSVLFDTCLKFCPIFEIESLFNERFSNLSFDFICYNSPNSYCVLLTKKFKDNINLMLNGFYTLRFYNDLFDGFYEKRLFEIKDGYLICSNSFKSLFDKIILYYIGENEN